MGRVVVVAYRPRPGKDAELRKLVQNHHAVLLVEKLVTPRKPVLMKAGNGCVIEVFEWVSEEAIKAAHGNAVVGQLWAKFDELCEYEKPVNINEFKNLFSEFESID